MKAYTNLLALLAVTIVLLTGCDTSEDPHLLNPPPPDSTIVRVINLMATTNVDVSFPLVGLTSGLGPLQASDFRKVWIPEQTVLLAHRTDRPRVDTLFNQTLPKGSYVDYLVFNRNDTAVQMIRLGLGKQEQLDLTANKLRQVSFINAVQDSSYFVKVGCISGETLFPQTSFAQSPLTVQLTQDEISIYLFSATDTLQRAPLASARVALTNGATPYLSTYIIAARQGAGVGLFIARAASGTGALQPAPPETRTTTDVELLNALSGNTPVSVALDGTGSTIVNNLSPLVASPAVQVDACVNPLGDSLVITPSGSGSFKTPVHLTVGGRTLVVVYGDSAGKYAVTLDRSIPAISDSKAHIRGINVSSRLQRASISFGAGAPEIIPADSRPFGTLAFGQTTGYVDIPAGLYPLMLSNEQTGTYVMGGIERLDAGYYTIVVADEGGTPSLMIVRDDQTGSALHDVGTQGARGTFFNLMPDADATFTIGSQTPRALAYSYVYSTVLPFTVTSITSNAGSVTIDPSGGGYLIGTTGSGGNNSILAIRSSNTPFTPTRASIRFLNIVPNGKQLAVRLDSATSTPIDTLSYGVPSPAREYDERQYSVVFTAPGDTSTVLARSDGVQISKGRRYILVVGPQRTGSTATMPYQTLWIQE
ncbi:MAG TPA: hypothetical protein VHI13_15020 [Candidatus Kapabacteria bacterium]|nr:hypothetical protein [Candidatus Kapabacteria bacterium]